MFMYVLRCYAASTVLIFKHFPNITQDADSVRLIEANLVDRSLEKGIKTPFSGVTIHTAAQSLEKGCR